MRKILKLRRKKKSDNLEINKRKKGEPICG